MERKSNIELLRLVAMLMVVNLHSFSGDQHGSGFLQMLDFFRQSASICAVNVFILISGYWGIKWKLKSFYNLAFQVLFYCFIIYFVCVGLGVEPFTFKGIMNQFMGLFKAYGFIRNYILLYFLAPILNLYAQNTTVKRLFYYIIILWIGEIIIYHDTITNFSLIYLVGRLINKTNIITYSGIKAHRSYWITTLLIFLCSYGLFYIYNLSSEKIQSPDLIIGWSYSAPLVIFQAIFLFLLFARLDITNRFINWCSSSCLSIFLIHMHPSIKYIYYGYTESLYTKPTFMHVCILIFLFSIIFIGSILVDKLRIAISDTFYKLLLPLEDKLTGMTSKIKLS